MNECKGIFGKLFGHKFVEAVDTFDAELSTEQLAELNKLAETTGAWETAVPFRVRIAAVYCKRCGMHVNEELRCLSCMSLCTGFPKKKNEHCLGYVEK